MKTISEYEALGRVSSTRTAAIRSKADTDKEFESFLTSV